MVIPTSPLLTFGARILRGKKVPYYFDFDFIIRVLSSVEGHGKSIYLLGMDMENIQEIERNIKSTFPDLMIVGRYSGYFSESQEQTIVTAIRKAGPALLFAGTGIPNKEIWLYRVKHKIKPSIMIWSGMAMDILAAKTQRPPKKGMNRLLHSTRQFITKPWRIYRFFIFLFYVLALLFWKITRR